jgi:hypothetical protein
MHLKQSSSLAHDSNARTTTSTGLFASEADIKLVSLGASAKRVAGFVRPVGNRADRFPRRQFGQLRK